MTNLQNILNIKYPDEEFYSQFKMFNLKKNYLTDIDSIKEPNDNNDSYIEEISNEKNNDEGNNENDYKKNDNIYLKEKILNFGFSNNNNDDDNSIRRISTLDLNFSNNSNNKQNNSGKNFLDSYQKDKDRKNLNNDLNQVRNITTDTEIDMSKITDYLKFEKEFVKKETENDYSFENNSNTSKDKKNCKNGNINNSIRNSSKTVIIKNNNDLISLSSNNPVTEKEIQELIKFKTTVINNIKNMENMLELLDNIITYKDIYQLENLKKLAKNNLSIFNEYLNQFENNLFNFDKGFLFQNYTNNGIMLDAINNFPKKGYSILFSFKWEPLYEQAIDIKCNLFCFLENKIINNKDTKKKQNNYQNQTKSDFYIKKEDLNKNLKLGCFILNRKLCISDNEKILDTNIEIIPGVSYVLIIDQREPCLNIKRISKVII